MSDRTNVPGTGKLQRTLLSGRPMKLQTHYHALLKLGIPIVIGQIGVIILGFADTLMIGHHSTPELAAASFVNNMFGLAIIFSTGFPMD